MNKSFERGPVLPVIPSSVWQHRAVPAVAMYSVKEPARKLSGHYYNMWSSELSTVYFWHVICSYSQDVDAYHNVITLIGMFQSLLPDYSC